MDAETERKEGEGEGEEKRSVVEDDVLSIASAASVQLKDLNPWKAATKGDLDVMISYLEKGGEIDARDHKNNTPLFWACQVGLIRSLSYYNGQFRPSDSVFRLKIF